MRKLLVWYKLWKRKYFLIPSFCRHCGCDVRDFDVPNDIWKQVEPHIKNGHTVCYNCFSDLCVKIGLPANWRLYE